MYTVQIKEALRVFADETSIPSKSRYFRSGKGEYGEGDQFIGVTVPNVRLVVKEFWKKCELSTCEKLLQSIIHEERLLALLLMVKKFERGDSSERRAIFSSYLHHKSHVNNWDLVDSSAFQIVGTYLLEHPDLTLLTTLAQSTSLWDRTIAIISTFAHIRSEQFEIPLEISKLLITDKEDLIHKAVGWMIREIGERSPQTERDFLINEYKTMPRTMLRYAIEKFPNEERQKWLKGEM